jgi:hypothetical protein
MSFSMAVRSKEIQVPLRRRRSGRVNRQSEVGERQASSLASRSAQHGVQPEPGPRSLRRGGLPQDHALYSCSCGCAFDAPVSTSVDCPHCGDRQAW